jgi:hypothetical protein
MVIKALLEGSIKGVGKLHKTPIFPCGIFQLMKGVNREPGDPNYDLYQLALESTAKRLYPNYANVDWSGNAGYDRSDPRTYFSTMGCRTANGADINAEPGVNPQMKDGRGNICPVTIIMPTLAMEAKSIVEDMKNGKYDVRYEVETNEGPVIIKDTDNVGTLHDILSELGTKLLIDTLPSIINGTNNRTPQNHEEATYAWNIKREEEHVDFNRSAKEVYNQIRGLNPWPTANAIIDDQEVKILEAYIGEKDSPLSPGIICELNKDNFAITTNDKIIHITKVKPFGKKIMDARDYINGMDREKFLNSIVK